MTGTTDSGKSELARRLFLAAAGPRLVIDPADSRITHVPGAVTWSDPARFPHGAATARFVPRDPFDLDAYDAVYRAAFATYPRWLWCDEAGIVLPVGRAPKAALRYIVQGRKRSLGHLACHTRPREVDRNLIANSRHVLVFELPNPNDRDHVAELVGVPRAVLEAEMVALPEHGFLWWNQRHRRLTACPPLEL